MALPTEEEKMKGVIHLPDKRNDRKDERPEKFEILATGPLVKEIKPGDIVLASKYAGTLQSFMGNEYFFLSEDACHAIIGEGVEVEERPHK